MKKSNLIKSVLLTGIALITISQMLTAQRGLEQKRDMDDRGPHYPRSSQFIPDLTEDQEIKMKELKTVHMKDMLKLKNELEEKNARLKSLQTDDNVDMDKIYKVIDDIGLIETKMSKKRADLHQEIRSLLSDEQRVYFDTHYLNKRMRKHDGNCKHMKQEQGKK